jgi:hypothetical protein
VMIKQTKQAQLTTTGVVAIERAWSGTGAFAFTAPRALSHRPAIRYTNPMNDGTDLTPALGTRAWSPPV